MIEKRGSLDGVFLDLSPRVKLRLSGDDRLRFLNGQITADARRATASNALEACLLDPKGRMTAHVFLFASPDAFLLDGDPALKETLQTRLERYVIADDVTVEDVSDRFSIFHCLGEAAPNFKPAKWIVSARRFNQMGWDIWVDTSEHGNFFQELSRTFRFCDSNCAEALRIEQGIPRWGYELTNEIIPVEADLEERCIDYEKGCYLGKEVISRMKMAGQKNKQLRGLVSVDNSPLIAGVRLFAEGKDAGWITSVSRGSKKDREIGLGFVKRGFNTAGTRLRMSESGSEDAANKRVEVVDLPFAQSVTYL
jgi:folate-binding protein YgfZ